MNRQLAPLVLAATALAACDDRPPSKADTMPPVGNAERQLVAEALVPYQPLIVSMSGSRVDAVLNEKVVTDTIYTSVSMAICFDQHMKKADFSTIGEIRFWNRGKFQGFAMPDPSMVCAQSLASTDGDEVRIKARRKLNSVDIDEL